MKHQEALTSDDAGKTTYFELSHTSLVSGTLRGEAFLTGTSIGKFWQNYDGFVLRSLSSLLMLWTTTIDIHEDEGQLFMFWDREMKAHDVQIVVSYNFDPAKELRRRQLKMMKTANRYRTLDAHWDC